MKAPGRALEHKHTTKQPGPMATGGRNVVQTPAEAPATVGVYRLPPWARLQRMGPLRTQTQTHTHTHKYHIDTIIGSEGHKNM